MTMLNEEIPLYESRCERFLEQIAHDWQGELVVFQAEFGLSDAPVAYCDRLKLEYKPIREGGQWGGTWQSAWFHLSADLPERWRGRELAARLFFSGEALIFDEKGVPEWSLTGQTVMDPHFEKIFYPVPAERIHDGKLELWVEAAANSLFGAEKILDINDNSMTYAYPGLVHSMRVGLFNREAWELLYDFKALFSLYRSLPEKDYRRRSLLDVLNRAVDLYGDDPAEAVAARQVLAPELARPAVSSAVEVTAVGHGHLDVGWLWPVRETVRKTARTFASQLKLIELYPEYIFGASQPQIYAFVKEHYPELYEKVKAAVKAGRWELQGGMWVEADCNLTSGESLVRQFLHGKNFFMDEFGVDVQTLWLPDVFGYAATLPQITRKALCRYFLTQKISWNQYNRFPYHSFVWEGIDGTEVLTHFPPEDSYNSKCTPEQIRYGQENCTESAVAPMMMSLCGIGDGGGGPSEQHLQMAVRVRDLEGCPRYRFGTSQEFFQKLEPAQPRLPRWRGELYLEMHRGTLTTQARTKRNNRKLEQALSQLEFTASCLPLDEYPVRELDALWKTLLLNQFHDILPGSSIREVYETTEKEHADALAKTARLLAERLPRLGAPDPESILAVNSLPYSGSAVVAVPADWEAVRGPDGGVTQVQHSGEDARAVVRLPASSVCTLRKASAAKLHEGTEVAAVADGGGVTLENPLVRYEFNSAGELIRANDKDAGRETIVPGSKGNVFRLVYDAPVTYDAWDVDPVIVGEAKSWRVENAKIAGLFSGPAEAGFTLTLTIGDSSVTQKIVLRADSKRLDFITRADWYQRHRLLQVCFPADVFADRFSCEIQYGVLSRPLNANTSWEKAKYEVPGQRFADLSEPDYGVALLNDCKYGYSAFPGELRLSLLRSPEWPDPQADQGEQDFTFSYLPHKGALADSPVMAEAAWLNRPPLLLAGHSAVRKAPFRLEGAHVALEVVKKAEKGDFHVLRLVETAGRRSRCRLFTELPQRLLAETDLLEWGRGAEMEFPPDGVELTLKPYEIRTYRVEANSAAN